MGLHPIPCNKHKEALVPWQKYQENQPGLTELMKWWKQTPDANVALVLGHGILVLDLDGEGAELLLTKKIVLPADAPRVKTDRGCHFYLASSRPVSCRTAFLSENGCQVDLKGKGGYALAPPSVHESGTVYQWIVPLKLPLPLAPDELFKLIKKQRPGKRKSINQPGWVVKALRGVPEGERDITCTSLAGFFIGRGLNPDIVKALLQDFASRCEPPFPAMDVKKCVDSIAKKEQQIINECVIHLSEITPQQVNWLWRNYVPRGKITLIDGDPGMGKSTISLDIAARSSRGLAMPDGTLCEAGGVVILTAEDGLADTVRPRLEVAGADLDKVVALTTAVGPDRKLRPPTLGDIKTISGAVQEVGAKLVIIDPLMAYLPRRTDSWKDQDVRIVLAQLAHMAEEMDVSVVVVRHLNKTASQRSLYRGGGSIGIIGAARSALLVASDPEDESRHILAPIKTNLCRKPQSLAFRIVEQHGIIKIGWEGSSLQSADALLAASLGSSEERSSLEDAKKFLKQILTPAPVLSSEVQKQALETGISRITLQRAKTTLGIVSTKSKGDGKWFWSLPEGRPVQGYTALQKDDTEVFW